MTGVQTCALPILAIYYSLTNFSLGNVTQFVGLANYQQIITDDFYFRTGMVNMLLIAITSKKNAPADLGRAGAKHRLGSGRLVRTNACGLQVLAYKDLTRLDKILDGRGSACSAPCRAALGATCRWGAAAP